MKLNATTTGLRLDNVSVAYDETTVVSGVSFAVPSGTTTAIVGASGCGKSTILSAIAGQIPFSGEITLGGEPVRRNSSRFAYMPQDDLLLPWRTVLDNALLYDEINGTKAQRIATARELLSEFGLSGRENAYPNELSGGMRQRAAFLRTAMCPAEVMLLDEPFAALDVITRREMQEWLLSTLLTGETARSAAARTTVLVTHDIDEALRLATRVLVMKSAKTQTPATVVGDFDASDDGARAQIIALLSA